MNTHGFRKCRIIFDSPLRDGILIRRYKRFLAEIKSSTGRTVLAHCANTGSMQGCAEPGSPVLYSIHNSNKRKIPVSWQAVQIHEEWVCINTLFANRLIKQALKNHAFPELSDFISFQSEVVVDGGRLDFLLERKGLRCYIEVKSVTLFQNKRAFFPDAVTLRGQRHLDVLTRLAKQGHRAVIFFLIHHPKFNIFSSAYWIDSDYAHKLNKAVRNGVEIMAYNTRMTKNDLQIYQKIDKIEFEWPERIGFSPN